MLGAVTLLLHAGLMGMAALALAGVQARVRARLQGRAGPPLLQPFRDLRRLARKQPLLPETASPVLAAAPFVAFAAMAAAALLTPSFTLGMASAPVADLIVLAGLLATHRAAMAMAAMDAGTAAGGVAASRAMSLGVLAESALLLVVFVVANLAGSTNLDAAAAVLRDSGWAIALPLGLAASAAAIVALAEAGRFPAPEGGLGLGLGQDPARAAFSGWHLALVDAAGALRVLVWCALLVVVFVPAGIAAAGSGVAAWIGGLLAWGAKLLVLTAALAAFGSEPPHPAVAATAAGAGGGTAARIAGSFVPVRRPGLGVMAGATHALGGGMLVLALLMLAQRRMAVVIGSYTLLSAALGLAMAAQGSAVLVGLGAVVLAVQCGLIPTALRRVAPATTAPSGSLAALFGFGVAALLILAVREASLPPGMAREDLAAGLAVTLLGLLAVAAGRDPWRQTLGFLTAGAGLMFTGATLPGAPPPLLVMAAGLLLVPALGVLMLRRVAG